MSNPSTARRWVVLPFAFFVVLALAWSAAWYFAAQRADAMVTAWLEQEKSRGRAYSCGSRTSGGYPFRIEMRCSEPAAELVAANAPADQAPRVLRAKELVGVAQVYQPGLVIAEITGPLSIASAGESAEWIGHWRLAQASLRGSGGKPERISVVLDQPKLAWNEGAASGTAAETWAVAEHVELHVRRDPASPAEAPVIDIVGQLARASVPSATVLAGRQLDAEFTAQLSGLSDLRAKPAPTRLKEWQAAGGRLRLTRLRLQQGDAVAVAVGEIGLSPGGRPDGAFEITMAGFDQLVKDLAGRALGGSLQFGMTAALSLLGRPAEIEGKRGVSVPLRFDDGAVRLGPLRLGKMDPLF